MCDNKEHEKFNTSRYRLTHQSSNSRSYLDLKTGIGYCLPWQDPRWSSTSGYAIDQNTERAQYIALRDYMKSRLDNDNYQEENNKISSDNQSSILEKTDDIIQIIVGVSIGKFEISFYGLLEYIFGAHAFIIYNEDPYGLTGKYQNDIMLDASGHYGEDTFRQGSTNIIYYIHNLTTSSTFTIDGYRRYFYTKNKKVILYTYTYIIDKKKGKAIREFINDKSPRTELECTKQACRVLEQTGLFPWIGIWTPPVFLKNFLDKFTPLNEEIIALKEKKSYDLEKYP